MQVCSYEYVTLRDEGNQVLAFEKGDILFVFNFSCVHSYSDYRVPVRNFGSYRCVLSVMESNHRHA